MAVLVPSLYVLAGAIAYAMLYSLVAPAGRRDAPTLRAFAATCLFAALVALFAAHVHQAGSNAEFLRALKSNLDCLVLTALAYSVFVARYTRLNGRRSRIAFGAYAAACLILIVLNEAWPYGLQYARFDGIAHLRLPWGETIARGSGRRGPLAYVTVIAVVGVVPYAAAVLLHLYRRTRDRSALWMLASLAVLVPFAVEGALVRLSLLRGFAASPIGILIVIAVTGATLAQETKRRLLSSEAALQDSERKLRNLFELSPLGIVLTVDGHYREFNRAFEAMTGYPAEELRGMSHAQLTPRQYQQEQQRQIDLLARTGRFGPFEKEYRRKDGSLVPLRLNGVLIGDGIRRVVWSLVEDISADRRAQDRLRESEMRLRSLIEQSPLAISFSRDGITLEVNARYLSMFGYASAEEVCDTPLLQRVASGVETREQVEVLRECGCTRYQGYLFGRPQAADRLFEVAAALSSC